MTTFPTPSSISARIDVAMGDVEVRAEHRSDTEVEVRPSDPGHKADVRAAEQTRVEYADGALEVMGPRQRGLTSGRKKGSIHVTVSLPTRSSVDSDVSVGSVTAEGELGECKAKLGAGDISVADAADVDLKTSLGSITAAHVAGQCRCTTASGVVSIERVDGSAEIKNSNGNTWVGETHAPLRAKSANGSIAIGNAHAGLTATTANGDLSVDAAHQGAVELKTSLGRINVGIPNGVAVRLDVQTSFGNVVNHLDDAAGPDSGESVVDVLARTSAGDIEITRASTVAL